MSAFDESGTTTAEGIEDVLAGLNGEDIEQCLCHLRVEFSLVLVHPVNRVASGLPFSAQTHTVFETILQSRVRMRATDGSCEVRET